MTVIDNVPYRLLSDDQYCIRSMVRTVAATLYSGCNCHVLFMYGQQPCKLSENSAVEGRKFSIIAPDQDIIPMRSRETDSNLSIKQGSNSIWMSISLIHLRSYNALTTLSSGILHAA